MEAANASVSEHQSVKIMPSHLKFGFLGLGIMGGRIVKNLLKSGHSVIVWNRTPDECRKLVTAGAVQGKTPLDVVREADITFSCISGPSAVKELMFHNSGILQEINSGKGYVEMTTIDAGLSKAIAEAIKGQGGRYLEAQVQGSIVEAEEGTLIILAAGDRSLFDECMSCFKAMGKSCLYFAEVGNASKMNLVLQLMTGVTLAGLAEGMALARSAGLQTNDVLRILNYTSLACPMIIEKGKAMAACPMINEMEKEMAEGDVSVHLPLEHMQKDLTLSLKMGNQLVHPLPLAAAANEIFQGAKRMGFGESDVSCVSMRVNF